MNDKLDGLQRFIDDNNEKVTRALQVFKKVKRYLKWIPHPAQFEEPKIRFQDAKERPISILLYGWTMEAVCMWVFELADFIKEEPTLCTSGAIYYTFSNFDVDISQAQGCYWKGTGEFIETKPYEKTILVCN